MAAPDGSPANGAFGQTAQAMGLVDTKAIGKPQRFSGKPEHWDEWSWKFESYCSLLGMEEVMRTAGDHEVEIDVSTLRPDVQALIKTLYHVMVQLLDGRASRILRAVPRGNGAEAWRQLKREYQPQIAQRKLAMLASIMSPDLSGPAPHTDEVFEDRLCAWEKQISDYESQTGKTVDDDLKIAVLLKAAPGALRAHLQLNVQAYESSWTRLRAIIFMYLQSRRAFTIPSLGGSSSNPPQEHVPMDIGEVDHHRGKGKGGKGKKGGGKGQGRDKQHQGVICYNCGKEGHMAKDCWAKQAQQPQGKGGYGKKGKPKGKGKGGKKGGLNEVVPEDTAEEGQEQGNGNGGTGDQWVMAIGREGQEHQQQVGKETWMLLDSGVFDHVCPVDFAPAFPMLPASRDVQPVVTASGTKMLPMGTKVVDMHTFEATGAKRNLRITFVVIPVRRVLLSVGKLMQGGFSVHFESKLNRASITRGRSALPLHVQGTMFYLKAFMPAASPNQLLAPLERARPEADGLLCPLVGQDEEMADEAPMADASEQRPEPAAASGKPPMPVPAAAVDVVPAEAGPRPKRARPQTDRWLIRDGSLVRVHDKPRLALFVPRGVGGCPVALEQIGSQRATYHLDARTEQVGGRISDDWRTGARPGRSLGEPWVGETMFQIMGPAPPDTPEGPTQGRTQALAQQRAQQPGQASTQAPAQGQAPAAAQGSQQPPAQERAQAPPKDRAQAPAEATLRTGPRPRAGEEEAREGGARTARAKAPPTAPTPAQVRQHELTHLPPMPWCRSCMSGKIKDDPHRRREELSIATLYLDYCFIPEPVLTGYLDEAKMGFAYLASDKSSKCEEKAGLVLAFLRECGYAGVKIRIHTDQEPAMLRLAEHVASKRSEAMTVVRSGVAHSSQSQGPVERFIQDLVGQIRTLKISYQQKTGMELEQKSPLLSFLVRHSAWLLNRYMVRSPEGKTGYELTTSKPYQSALLQFGETVYMRFSDALQRAKLAERGCEGVWLGRSSQSDGHLVATPQGICETRTVRRLPEGDMFSRETIARVKFDVLPGRLVEAGEAGPSQPEARLQLPGMPPVSSERASPEDVAADGAPSAAASGGGRGDNAASRALHEFYNVRGRTDGCYACRYGPSGRVHSALCKKRQREHREQATEGMRQEPSVPEGVVVNPGGASSGSGVPPSPPPAQQGQQVAEPAPAAQQSQPSERVVLANLPPVPADDLSMSAKRVLDEPAEPVATRARTAEPTLPGEAQASAGQVPHDENMIGMLAELSSEEGDGADGDYTQEELQKAREKELEAMRGFCAFEEVDRSTLADVPHRTVTSRWVYTRKPTGEVKARLVAREVAYTTAPGLFSPTPVPTSVRLALTQALKEKRCIAMADVSTAFLHAAWTPDPEEPDIQMCIRPPPTHADGNSVWVVKKAVYGLRRSPRLWQEHWSQLLVDMGFTPTVSDPTMHIHQQKGMTLVTHVDDVLATGKKKDLTWLWSTLQQHVKLKITCQELGLEWTRFLGREWSRTGPSTAEVRIPGSYVDGLLSGLGLAEAKVVDTPAVPSSKQDEESPPLDQESYSKFRTGLGKLLWMVSDRPDLAFSVKEMCRCANAPTETNLVALKRICRYVKGTRDATLKLHVSPSSSGSGRGIVAFVDASWVSDGKSTSGVAIFLDGVAITASSKTQSVIALSSGESELYAISSGSMDCIGLRNQWEEMTGEKLQIWVHSDSSAAIATCSRRGTGRLRHVELKHLWMQQKIASREIRLTKVLGTENCSDVLTKALIRIKHLEHALSLGMCVNEPTRSERDVV